VAAPSPELRLALVQVASSTVPAENRDRLASLDVGDADLVVLPEYYQRDAGAPDEPLGQDAELLDGPFVAALTERARAQGGTWVAGMLEVSDDPRRPFNTLVVVDGDGPRASYRKIHLYDSFGFRESDRLVPGARTPTALEVHGTRVGLMTCYDLRFPELGRALSRTGVDLVLVPSAWVAGPRKVHHWRTLVIARAIENLVYVAAVGQPGPRYTGHTVLVDPRGDVVTETGDADAVVLTGAVSATRVDEARAENPSLLNRRDETPWELPAAGAVEVG
jgi:predicted amidohydrolase